MTEVTPIRPEDEEDHSLKVAMMLTDLAAVGDLLSAYKDSEELCENTIRDVGYLVRRHATRIDELLYGGAS